MSLFVLARPLPARAAFADPLADAEAPLAGLAVFLVAGFADPDPAFGAAAVDAAAAEAVFFAAGATLPATADFLAAGFFSAGFFSALAEVFAVFAAVLLLPAAGDLAAATVLALAVFGAAVGLRAGAGFAAFVEPFALAVPDFAAAAPAGASVSGAAFAAVRFAGFFVLVLAEDLATITLPGIP